MKGPAMLGTDIDGRTPIEWHEPDPAEIRVPFGDRPNQVLPIAWAELFLRIVYTEYPQVFRAILPRLYELPEPEPKRRRGE